MLLQICHRIKRTRQPDWITPGIDYIKERMNCKTNGNLDQYRILRNKVTSLIKKFKQNVYQAEIENGKDDPSQDIILNVKFNNNFTSNGREITDIFNTFSLIKLLS